MKYLINKEQKGAWGVQRLTKNSVISGKDYIIVDGGKKPQLTYTCLQEILGGLDDASDYKPVPFGVVENAIKNDARLKICLRNVLRVPYDWREQAEKDVPELWKYIKSLPLERFIPHKYDGTTASQQERNVFCTKLLRLTVWMSYAFRTFDDNRGDIIQDALLGLNYTARAYKSGDYLPSNLLRKIVRQQIFKNRGERQDQFGLVNSLSAWVDYEKRLNELFAAGLTNPTLQERYEAFVESGGSNFRTFSTPLSEIYRRFAVAEKMYFASFSSYGREPSMKDINTVNPQEHPKYQDYQLEDIVEEQLRCKIKAILNTLSFRERTILTARYGLDDCEQLTFADISKIFKITKERILQIRMSAIKKLQHPIRAKKLSEFI